MNNTTTIDDSLRSLSLDYLNLLINGQAFSDVTFSVDGRLVHAHRCILAARSIFFRKFFCAPDGAGKSSPVIIPVNSVGYEVFLLLLQFLYTGQVSVAPQKHEAHCAERNCCHTHCSSAVDLALDTLAAARTFGVDHLALLTQKQLTTLVDKASIEDVMKVLLASRKREMHQLWNTCSHLVAKSGLPPEVLAKHLPIDLVAKIEVLRLKSPSFPRTLIQLNNPNDHKIRRMRRALDSSDVELVKLMVMGEGLNLNSALALHYAVERCSREVVKALLELGAADVDFPAGPAGKSALHLAAEMVSPDMVAVLLDHHADPNVKTVDGVTPLDVLRNLTSEFLFNGAVPGLAHIEPNKLRLCLELVQSAALVISREDNNNHSNNNLYETMGEEHNDGCTRRIVNLNLDSKMVYPNRPQKMEGGDDSITSGSTNQRNANSVNSNAMIQHGSIFHQHHDDRQY